MKLTRTLLAAAATAAFALPAAAQHGSHQPAPATEAETATPQTTEPDAAAPAQPGPTPQAAQQPTTQTAPAATTAQAQPGTPPAATPADLRVGAAVIGSDGQAVGTIAEADATGAVVRSDAGQGRLNLDAFFKDARGILIGYTRAQFNELVGGTSAQGGPEETEEAAEPAPASTDPQ